MLFNVVMNYFSLFKLPIRYQIDMKLLVTTFHNLQRQYHPDKFVGSTQAEKAVAEEQSSVINQAWQILRNPLARAEHLLFLHGFNLTGEQNIVKDPIFLMEQLNLREELSNIEQERNKVQLGEFIKRIQKIFDIQYQQMIDQLNNEEWNLAVDTVQKLRFIKKLRDSSEQLVDNLLVDNLFDF